MSLIPFLAPKASTRPAPINPSCTTPPAIPGQVASGQASVPDASVRRAHIPEVESPSLTSIQVKSSEDIFAHYKFEAEVNNNPHAQYIVAQYYTHGKGVTQNFELALSYFFKSAEQAYVRAQHALGLCFLNGLGTSKDHQRALHYLTAAANNNDPESLNILSQYYKNNNENEKALHFLQRAAEHGHPKAQFEWALYCYDTQRDHPNFNINIPLISFVNANAKGYRDALFYIGEIYSENASNLPVRAEFYLIEHLRYKLNKFWRNLAFFKNQISERNIIPVDSEKFNFELILLNPTILKSVIQFLNYSEICALRSLCKIAYKDQTMPLHLKDLKDVSIHTHSLRGFLDSTTSQTRCVEISSSQIPSDQESIFSSHDMIDQILDKDDWAPDISGPINYDNLKVISSLNLRQPNSRITHEILLLLTFSSRQWLSQYFTNLQHIEIDLDLDYEFTFPPSRLENYIQTPFDQKILSKILSFPKLESLKIHGSTKLHNFLGELRIKQIPYSNTKIQHIVLDFPARHLAQFLPQLLDILPNLKTIGFTDIDIDFIRALHNLEAEQFERLAKKVNQFETIYIPDDELEDKDFDLCDSILCLSEQKFKNFTHIPELSYQFLLNETNAEKSREILCEIETIQISETGAFPLPDILLKVFRTARQLKVIDLRADSLVVQAVNQGIPCPYNEIFMLLNSFPPEETRKIFQNVEELYISGLNLHQGFHLTPKKIIQIFASAKKLRLIEITHIDRSIPHFLQSLEQLYNTTSEKMQKPGEIFRNVLAFPNLESFKMSGNSPYETMMENLNTHLLDHLPKLKDKLTFISTAADG